MNDTTLAKSESPVAVAIGGLLVVVFGLFAVMTAIGMGWAGAVLVGVGLLLFAWKIPTSGSARVLPVILSAFGVIALLGAVFDLLA